MKVTPNLNWIAGSTGRAAVGPKLATHSGTDCLGEIEGGGCALEIDLRPFQGRYLCFQADFNALCCSICLSFIIVSLWLTVEYFQRLCKLRLRD